MLRTFIAVRIPQNQELTRLHRRLSSLGDSFRPVALDRLHVTLKFLGETEKRRVSEISEVIQNVAGRHLSHSISLRGLGAFPGPHRPSVFWVGIQEGQTLRALAAALEAELSPLGFVPESRPFQPHLTMLRVKVRPPEVLFSLLDECAETDFGTANIQSLEFFQSELQQEGPRYTLLSTACLAPRAVVENTDPILEG